MTKIEILELERLIEHIEDYAYLEQINKSKLKLTMKDGLGLSKVLLWGFGLPFVMLIIFIVENVRSLFMGIPPFYPWILCFFFFIGSLFFFFFSIHTRCYYIFDMHDRTLTYSYFFFSIHGEKEILTFDDIAGIAVVGKRTDNEKQTSSSNSPPSPYLWEYAISLISHRGKQVRISDFYKENERPIYNHFVKLLGWITNLPSYPNHGELVLTVKRSWREKTVQIYHEPYSMWNKYNLLGLVPFVVYCYMLFNIFFR